MMRAAVLALLLVIPGGREARKPRFHVGQVVAIMANEDPPQYFRVGFVDREIYLDGTPYFKYTEATEKIDGEWPEGSLRALTREECR